MIITCPNCSARYKVKDELIQAKGKRVKCKKCEAVFLTFPDRDAVLESAPQAASTPAAPSPEAPAPVAQATVKVDRSQLDKFLQNNAMDGTQSTVKVDPDQFKRYLDDQKSSSAMAAGATVQVDRSQIDAFLKDNSAAPPKAAPSASETVQLDPSTLSHLAAGNPEFSSAQTIAMARPALAELTAAAQASATAATEVAPLPPTGPQVPKFSAPAEPRFPSDEELGIAEEKFEPPPAPAPTASHAEPPDHKPAAPAQVEKMYQAEVEGQVYPNLPLDAIARWVREGRLLEQDRVAVNGTQDYREAQTYPEIRRYFEELNASQPAQPPVKKGFFARLFSFGK